MKTIGKEYTNKMERIAFLKDNCDKVVEKSYSKAFKPEELQQYKEELVQVCDKIDSIEEEKKAAAKEFKLQLAEQAQGNDWQYPEQGENRHGGLLSVHRPGRTNHGVLQ